MSSHDQILSRLATLREGDAPTHGGRVLSYVYDSGRADLDELAAAAVAAMQPVNGLDPTTFTSVATLERELIGFVPTTPISVGVPAFIHWFREYYGPSARPARGSIVADTLASC